MKKNILVLALLSTLCGMSYAHDSDTDESAPSPPSAPASQSGIVPAPGVAGTATPGTLSDSETDDDSARQSCDAMRHDSEDKNGDTASPSKKRTHWCWSTQAPSIQNKLQASGFSIACLKAVDAPILFGAHVAKVHALAVGKPLKTIHTPAASVIPATLRAIFDMAAPVLIASESFAHYKKGMGKQTTATIGMGVLTSIVVLTNLILHGLSNKTLHLKGARLQAFRAGIQSYTKGLGTWVATQIGLAGVQLTIDELLAIITADCWRRGHQDLITTNNWPTTRYTLICLLTIAKNLLDLGKRIPQVSMVEDMVKRGAPIVGVSA